MKSFRWNSEKNEALQSDRGLSFERIVIAIESGGLLDVRPHPNAKRYPDQSMFVVVVDGYVCLVPFVEEEDHVFLKTIIPSRKATRIYLRKAMPNDQA